MGQQLTGRFRAMEPQGHFEIVTEKGAAPVSLGAVLGHREEEAAHDHRHAAEERHADQHDHRRPHIGPVDGSVVEGGHDQVVGDRSQHPGAADRGEHIEQRPQHRGSMGPGMGAQRSPDQPSASAPHMFVLAPIGERPDQVTHGVTVSGAARTPRRVSEAVDDGARELRALDLGGAVHETGEVVGDHLVADGGLDRTDDVVGGVLPSEVFEHHHAGEQHR